MDRCEVRRTKEWAGNAAEMVTKFTWVKQRAGLRNGQRFRKKCDSLDHINDATIFSRYGA